MASHEVFGGGQLIAVPINGTYTTGRLTETVTFTERPDGSLDKAQHQWVNLFDGTRTETSHKLVNASVMLQPQTLLPKVAQDWHDVTPASVGAVIAIPIEGGRYELARISQVYPGPFYDVETADGSYTNTGRDQRYMAGVKVFPMHLTAHEAQWFRQAHWQGVENSLGGQIMAEEESESHQLSY